MVHVIATIVFLLIFVIINLLFNPSEYFKFYRYEFTSFEFILSNIPVILIVAIAVIIKLLKSWNKDVYKDYILSEEKTDDFKNLYTKLYTEYIQVLEYKRKNIRNRIVFAYFLMVIFILVYFVYNYSHNFELEHIWIVGVCLWVIYLIYNQKHVKDYRILYKNSVIQGFIKHLNPNLKLEKPDQNAAMLKYKSVNFGDRQFDLFSCDDYVNGMLNDEVYLELFDIHTHYQTHGRNKRIVELFQGIFAYTICKKDINSEIRINKNALKITESNRVKMDSTEFEKYFDVYAKDRILTMRILTSDTMEYLINFFEKYQLKFEIVFKKNKIYFRFFTGPMFEPEVFNNSMNEDLLYIYYTIFRFIFEVTKRVNDTLDNMPI